MSTTRGLRLASCGPQACCCAVVIATRIEAAGDRLYRGNSAATQSAADRPCPLKQPSADGG